MINKKISQNNIMSNVIISNTANNKNLINTSNITLPPRTSQINGVNFNNHHGQSQHHQEINQGNQNTQS